MNFPLEPLRLPILPPDSSPELVNLQRELLLWSTQVQTLLNVSVQGVGPEIDLDDSNDDLVDDVTATKTTIAPTHFIHPVTSAGTNTLTTINTPYRTGVDILGTAENTPTHTGLLILLPSTATVAMDTSGNITLPSSPKTLTQNHALALVYEGTTWRPVGY